MGSEPVSSGRAWWLRRVGLVGLLVLLGVGAWHGRRRFIRGFFADGVAGGAPPLTPAPAGAAGLGAVARVRVALIDGLDAETAAGLPALSRLCAGGLDLLVDVGFPTVSLPVQAVLWTGRTQQQSGIQYRIAATASPVPGSAPLAVPGSLALVEEQPFIARSFGFSLVAPATGWTAPELASIAGWMVATELRLVFVHLLRVDKAGHKAGPPSPAYESAARGADELLGRLVAAAPPGPATRWLVLSDHGHRRGTGGRGGGHGGGEPAVRIVRACLAGGGDPLLAPRAPPPAVHLADLSRAVFDSLGLPAPAGAAGRPLSFAITHPDRDATLPHASPLRLAAAGALVVLGLLATAAAAARGRLGLAAWPWWLPLSYLSIVVLRGLPTLSNPIVYPPLGRDIVLAGAPGLGLLVVLGAVALRRRPGQLGRIVVAQLALLVATALAALAVCGGLGAVAGVAGAGGGPPLLPRFTAHASVLLSLLSAAALLVAALAAGATAVAAWRARGAWPPLTGRPGDSPR